MESRRPQEHLQTEGRAPRDLIPSHCRGSQGANHAWMMWANSFLFDMVPGCLIPLYKGSIAEQWICIFFLRCWVWVGTKERCLVWLWMCVSSFLGHPDSWKTRKTPFSRFSRKALFQCWPNTWDLSQRHACPCLVFSPLFIYKNHTYSKMPIHIYDQLLLFPHLLLK